VAGPGISLDGNASADVTGIGTADNITVNAGGGNDTVNGAAFGGGLTLNGGPGVTPSPAAPGATP